jgi:hypothetical protein
LKERLLAAQNMAAVLAVEILRQTTETAACRAALLFAAVPAGVAAAPALRMATATRPETVATRRLTLPEAAQVKRAVAQAQAATGTPALRRAVPFAERVALAVAVGELLEEMAAPAVVVLAAAAAAVAPTATHPAQAGQAAQESFTSSPTSKP